MTEQQRLERIAFLKNKRLTWSIEFEELTHFQNEVGRDEGGREIALMITKAQEMKHWAGEALSKLGAPNPYPNSKDPSNAVIDPPADTHRAG